MYKLTRKINWKHIHASLKTIKRLDSTSIETKKTQKKIEEIFNSKPVASKVNLSLLPPRTVIDENTIALLERLSLVNCANKEGIKTLEDAIAFADQILQVDTKNVNPLVTVLEDWPLRLREDVITDKNLRDDILSNAAVTEEEYFVAPPGNIPLETRDNLLHEETVKKINNDNKI